MILVRDVLEIDPAQMKMAKEATRGSQGLLKRLEYGPTRMMTDFVGTYYTFVIESEFPDLAAFETSLAGTFQDPEWQAFYGKLRPHVRGGRREVYTLL